MIFIIGKNPLKKIIQDTVKTVQGDYESVIKLNEKIKELKLEREDILVKKSIEEQELKHLVKMKEEKQVIELEKEKIKLQHEHQKTTMDLQNTYHDKILKNIEESRIEMNNVYKEIMSRLPNVNMEIKKSTT